MPHVGHSLFQQATTDPLQGRAEPLSQVGGISGKTYLRKGRRHWRDRKEDEEKVRNSRRNTKVREERGGGTPCLQSRYPLQPMED